MRNFKCIAILLRHLTKVNDLYLKMLFQGVRWYTTQYTCTSCIRRMHLYLLDALSLFSILIFFVLLVRVFFTRVYTDNR